jgi:hypothetical protein
VPHDPPFRCPPSASNGNLTLVREPLTAVAREEVRELLMQRLRKIVKLRARELRVQRLAPPVSRTTACLGPKTLTA